MCLGRHRTGFGNHVVNAQCPSTETTAREHQQQLHRFAKMHPEMTVAYLASLIQKPVWYILELLLFDVPESPNYPRAGECILTKSGNWLIVDRADKFAVHWIDGTFSYYSDLDNFKWRAE